MDIAYELKVLLAWTFFAFMLLVGAVCVWNSIAYRASLKHTREVNERQAVSYEQGAGLKEAWEKSLAHEEVVFTRFEALMERAEKVLEKFEKERES